MDGTLDFYDSDPEGYSDRTFDADTSHLRDRFIVHIPEGGRILDLGCGSGRDTMAFRSMGYDVVPVDGSEGICRVAQRNTGVPVRRLLFSELDYHGEFDGVYACSSLLHVPSSELPHILSLICEALRDGGYLYMSFKKGDFEGSREGRHYTDMDEGSIRSLADSCGFEVKEIWLSKEPDRDLTWVNTILCKTDSDCESVISA